MLQLNDPVHFTRLRHMHRSPAHYRAAVLEPREPTAAMRFGSIVHAVLFRTPYHVWEGRRAGKEWDAFQAEVESANPGALIITAAESERAHRCAGAIGARPDATRLLVGQHEVERSWVTLGRECAGRIDVIGADFITELKTTSNAQPETFLRGALRLGYHSQIPWYADGVGMPNATGHMVVVETLPPFDVAVFDLTPRCMQEGRKLYRLWMERLLSCEASNDWPGYCQSPIPFDVPDLDEPLIIDGEEVEAA